MLTASQSKKVLFLSLSSDRAKKIISGKINTEIKSISPDVKKGDIVMIYANSPVEQVIGMCTVDKIIKDSPENFWKMIGKSAGLKKYEIMDMLKDMTFGYAIVLKNAIPMYKPIHIDEIKSLLPGFMPPMSCKYFTYRQFMNLMSSSAKYAAIS